MVSGIENTFNPSDATALPQGQTVLDRSPAGTPRGVQTPPSGYVVNDVPHAGQEIRILECENL